MTRFQQALKGAFFKISTYDLLQVVAIEKGIFFSYMIHEDTLKIMEMRAIYKKVVILTKSIL